MRTVRRLLYKDIIGAVVLVALSLLSLSFFIDFVDEIDRMARASVGPGPAALVTLTQLPGHFYESFPIAVLIGAILALSRLAQSSEFTILRTGGLGPGRALALLASLATAFAVITFVVGDYVAPRSDQAGDQLRARFTRAAGPGKRGAWLKDHQKIDGQERNFSVNVERVGGGSALEGVRIFEFDPQGGLKSRTEAEAASVDADGLWRLLKVHRTIWEPGQGGVGTAVVSEQTLDQFEWHSSLHAGVIAAAVLPAMSMSTLELYRYTAHLSAQEQSAQAHNIQFWRKAFYPFACFVMVALALPFAYLHGRSGGISIKVFGGIMLGISFVLLNNVAGHLGLLKNWTPWVVAATPSLIYLGLSLAAFTWLVRYR